MTIRLELPDDLMTHENPSREALEAIAIEGYRTEQLSSRQAAELVGMGRLEFEMFLKRSGVTEHSYSLEQLENDIATSARLRARGLLTR